MEQNRRKFTVYAILPIILLSVLSNNNAIVLNGKLYNLINFLPIASVCVGFFLTVDLLQFRLFVIKRIINFGLTTSNQPTNDLFSFISSIDPDVLCRKVSNKILSIPFIFTIISNCKILLIGQTIQ